MHPGITAKTPPEELVADVACNDLLVPVDMMLKPHVRKLKLVILVRSIGRDPVHVQCFPANLLWLLSYYG